MSSSRKDISPELGYYKGLISAASPSKSRRQPNNDNGTSFPNGTSASLSSTANGHLNGSSAIDVQTNSGLIVNVRRAAGYKKFDSARLHISVGQPYHEGQEFEATLRWAMNNNRHVIICVNDTLQRHNLIFEGHSAEDALEIARQAGSDWLERNLPTINKLQLELDSNDVRTVRWENWRAHDEYDSELSKVQNMYVGDSNIRDAIDEEAKRFWVRRQKVNDLTDNFRMPDFIAHSVEYLKEECAIFSIMFREVPPSSDIYPGSSLLPCSLFKPEEQKHGSAHGYTRIDFRDPVTKKPVLGGSQTFGTDEVDPDPEMSSALIVPDNLKRRA